MTWIRNTDDLRAWREFTTALSLELFSVPKVLKIAGCKKFTTNTTSKTGSSYFSNFFERLAVSGTILRLIQVKAESIETETQRSDL
ncbi:MAG: hypothetical protein JST85_20985 [Acidobacteria bacterium]|nr:hypothetical protein [Acidobacteriota bacterium]